MQSIWRTGLPLSRALRTSCVPLQLETASINQQTAARPVWEIPGPRKYPIVGSIPSFLMEMRGLDCQFNILFQNLVKKYGPIFKIENPLNPPMVFLANPDDAETLIRATMDNPLREAFLAIKKIRQEAIDDYFEKKTGILTENGEEWWRVRSRVQTPMMKPKNVILYLPAMDEVTLAFMDRIAYLQSQFGEMPSNFHTELQKWALESVGLVALNRRLGCLEPDLKENSNPMKLIKLVNELFHDLNDTEFGIHFWRLFPTPSYRKLKKNHDEFIRLADQNIRETEASLLAKTPEDDQALTLMEQLLLTPGLSRKDVVTLMVDMLSAGIDTTSNTIAFTLYLLARNPEVQARLQAEVDTVLGDHQGPIQQKHLAQLSYLKCVIKESMRIFPLAMGIARTLDKDAVLNGYTIPKTWTVVTLNMLMAWDESLFPRAKEFLPERWSRDRPLGPIHPYAALPFGAGTRMCFGRRIAEQEMYLFLTRVMQQYTINYEYEDIGHRMQLVFMPSKSLRFSFIKRH